MLFLGNFSTLRIFTNININIQYSFFYRINLFNGNGDGTSNLGGCIYISEVQCNLSIEDSVFYNSSSVGNGGAIYFSSTYSQSQLKRICGIKCLSNYYQFGFIKTNNNYINQIEFISLSQCSYEYSQGYYTFQLNYGIQIISNVNSSNHLMKGHSGLSLADSNSINALYFNYFNCTVSEGPGACLWRGSQTRNLSYGNIIKLIQYKYGVIYIVNGVFSLNHIYFSNNNFNLISNFQSTITLSNCQINHISSSLGTFSSTSCLITTNYDINTLKIQIYNTFVCFADFPLFNHFSIQKIKYKFNLILYSFLFNL